MDFKCKACDVISTDEAWDDKTNEMYPPQEGDDSECEPIADACKNDEMLIYGFACPNCGILDGEPTYVEKF